MPLAVAEYSEQENVLSGIDRAIDIFFWLVILGLIIFGLISLGIKIGENRCSCTVNYGGHNMSAEDAFERAGEGLTADQADEVQVLIEEYCK